MPVLSDPPSGRTICRSRLSEPKNWPNAVAPLEVSVKIAVSPSGAVGARSSHALSASARAPAG